MRDNFCANCPTFIRSSKPTSCSTVLKAIRFRSTTKRSSFCVMKRSWKQKQAWKTPKNSSSTICGMNRCTISSSRFAQPFLKKRDERKKQKHDRSQWACHLSGKPGDAHYDRKTSRIFASNRFAQWIVTERDCRSVRQGGLSHLDRRAKRFSARR